MRVRPTHKRGLALSLAAGLIGLLTPPSASAQPLPDANCPGPRESGHAAPANGRFAQTFTAQLTGNLASAQIDVSKFDGDADWVMRIVEVDGTGTPTNVALATAVIPDATVPISGSTIITGTFASPAAVVAGQQYALVIARPGSGSGSLQVGGRGFSDACTGELFFSNNQAQTFSSVGAGADMVFAVFVEPAPLKADGTLTIDANKGKVEKGRKVTLSGQYDTPTNEACEPNRTIEIQRRKKSQPDTAFATFETAQTDATGNFSTREKVKKTYVYRAVVSETNSCDDELSNTQKVRVQKKKAAKEA